MPRDECLEYEVISGVQYYFSLLYILRLGKIVVPFYSKSVYLRFTLGVAEIIKEYNR